MTQAEPPIRWALLDMTGGAPCQNGEVMSQGALDLIARVLNVQLARDYGCGSTVRAGSSKDDVQPGERPLPILDVLEDDPGAVADHSVDELGQPLGRVAITDCTSLFGPGGVVMAASHEALETEGDRGCNLYASDGNGKTHARERCDAIEVQGYTITLDGQDVVVADFLLESWFIPGSPPPYTFGTSEGLPGCTDAPGPLETQPANGGNYQIEETDPGDVAAAFAKERACVGGAWGDPLRCKKHEGFPIDENTGRCREGMAPGVARFRISGTPKNPKKLAHWSSRASRRGVRLSPPA